MAATGVQTSRRRDHDSRTRFAPRAGRRGRHARSPRASPTPRSSSASRSPSPGPRRSSARTCSSARASTSTRSTRKGGVNGRKIVLKTLDDGYEPPRAVENTKKLINEEKVFALFGYVGTPTSAAVAADLHRGEGALRRRLHRRRAAAQPLQPLHLQRARELLRRDRGDRPAPHGDEREQDRGLLPERRLRPGRPRGRRARAQEAQPRDRGQGHRRAQHRRRRQGRRRTIAQGAARRRS